MAIGNRAAKVASTGAVLSTRWRGVARAGYRDLVTSSNVAVFSSRVSWLSTARPA